MSSKRAIEELPAVAETGDHDARHRGLQRARRSATALDVSQGNQRVLLHRARSHVRAALERHLDG